MRQIIVSVVCLLLVFQASGQIANIESKRKRNQEEGLSGSLDLTFAYIKNVDEVLQYGGNLSAFYFKNRHSFLLLLESALIQAEEQELVNNNFQHFRYNFRLGETSRFYLEGFEQLQKNRVQDIELRLLTGSGIRFKIVNNDSLQTSVGVTAMYEYERANNADLTESHIRSSSYIAFNYWATRNFNLNLIGYYQPLPSNIRDYRISTELSIQSTITRRLSFKTRVSLMYDSNPLPGIPNDIINITNGLAIAL